MKICGITFEQTIIVRGLLPVVPVNTACSFTDDDERWVISHAIPQLPMDGYSQQFINGFTPSLSTKRIAGIGETYAAASIAVVDANQAGWNPRRKIPFYRNKDVYDFLFSGVFDDAKDLADSNNFWAYTITFGFQPVPAQDGDPNTERPLLAVTAESLTGSASGYSALYKESAAEHAIEYRGFAGLDPVQEQRACYLWLIGTCAHEMGHAPGAHLESTDHAEDGLMVEGGMQVTGEASFRPITIHRLRTTTSWTGGAP